MPTPAQILANPDFVNANAETKQAIFNKHIAASPDYVNANPETQQAIATRFGLTPAQTAPAQTAPAQDKRSAWDKASKGDIVAGLPATRMIAGLASIPIVGAAQLGTDIGDWVSQKMGNDPVLGKWVAEKIGEYEAAEKRGMAALGGGPNIAGLGGSVVSGGVALKGLKTAATWFGKTVQGIGAGGFVGATTPSSTPGIEKRALQTGVGAAFGGFIPGVVAPVGKAGYRAAVEPILARGQQAIKQRALTDAAGDRATEVLNALRSPARNIVPGSMPTAGQAAVPAGSTGFSALQKSASQVPGIADDYLARTDAQKLAQLNQLRTVGQDKAALAAAEATRSANALVNYAAANNAGVDQRMAAELQPQIENLMNRPIMQSMRADATEWAANRSLGTPNFGSVEGLDYIKKALDRQITKVASRQDSIGKADLATLMLNKQELLATIKEIAPLYDVARSRFAADSVPINQMQVGQYLENKLIPALGEETGRLRAAAFAGAVKDAPGTLKRALTNSPRFEELTQILNPAQMKAVNSVVDDLARGARFEDMAKLAPSADAMALATQSIGGGGGAALPAVFSRVMTITNALIRRAEGKLDEKLARELAQMMLDPATTANALEKGIARGARNKLLGSARIPATVAGVQATTNMMNQGQ